MKCETCGKKFHYCSSCGFVEYKQMGYCSEECFKKSEEYKTAKEKIDLLRDTLQNNQKEALYFLWNEAILEEYEYQNDIEEMMKTI